MSEGDPVHNITSDLFPDGQNFVFPCFHLSEEGVVSSHVAGKPHELADLIKIPRLTEKRLSQASTFPLINTDCVTRLTLTQLQIF